MSEDTQRKLGKLASKIEETLVEELDAMTKEDLRSRIVRSEMNLAATEDARDADEGLQAAKEQVKELRSPYAEAAKQQKTLIKYCTLRLQELGEEGDAPEEVTGYTDE